MNAIEKFTLNNRFDDQQVKLSRLKTNRELDERIFQVLRTSRTLSVKTNSRR
ncbi:MAG: hypothetical protein IJP68_01090 [Selenomonadaceae bacterium]|nr:hypothetical protein [Selenomonadaceae bacterium]